MFFIKVNYLIATCTIKSFNYVGNYSFLHLKKYYICFVNLYKLQYLYMKKKNSDDFDETEACEPSPQVKIYHFKFGSRYCLNVFAKLIFGGGENYTTNDLQKKLSLNF